MRSDVEFFDTMISKIVDAIDHGEENFSVDRLGELWASEKDLMPREVCDMIKVYIQTRIGRLKKRLTDRGVPCALVSEEYFDCIEGGNPPETPTHRRKLLATGSGGKESYGLTTNLDMWKECTEFQGEMGGRKVAKAGEQLIQSAVNGNSGLESVVDSLKKIRGKENPGNAPVLRRLISEMQNEEQRILSEISGTDPLFQ